MKINVRLLLIIFSAVVLISVPSTLIFYSSAKELLQKQHSEELINSANDFIFTFQQSLQTIDEEFRKLKKVNKRFAQINLDSTALDFILVADKNNKILKNYSTAQRKKGINLKVGDIKEFVSYNPSVIYKVEMLDSLKVIYGINVTAEFLNDLAKRIRAEVALINNGIPVEYSNPAENKNLLLNIIGAAKELKNEDNFTVVGKELKDTDFWATHYSPTNSLADSKLDFLIFSKSKEIAEFRSTMGLFVLIILVAGILLSIILVFLFTGKIRKQISLIDETVSKISSGSLDHRVEILSKDELGRLGEAFNGMLDELKQKEKEEKDYSEFLALINKNPTLSEISNAALKKIIETTGMNFGALHLVESGNFKMLASYGFGNKQFEATKNIDLYTTAINEKQRVEFKFTKNFPVVSTGLTKIQIKYILILPIIYNNEVIAILELASECEPEQNVNKYLENIQEQLSIGITNAKAVKQLKDLVKELKKLNDAYHLKNKKVTEQNEELIRLHEQLKTNAKELERQTQKALESAKVKAQFLANMSHELRTPQNSIIGLTELLINDSATPEQVRNKLKIVLRNSKKLLNLINNILEFSKIESGNIELKKGKFTLSEFLEEINQLIEPLVQEKDLQFEITVNPSKNYLLNADKTKLEQIFYNLVGNAVKFTDSGFIKINIEISDNKSFNFEVIDSGIGIAEEKIETVFEEFRQAEEGMNRKYEGTGLGLTICKKYVELFGGKIEARSKLGSGSTFRVELPGIVENELENGIKQGDGGTEAKGKSVAVLAQSENVTKFIGDYLAAHNIEIKFSNSEPGFIEEIKSAELKELILDVNTVKSSPWSLLYDLKKSFHLQNVSVALTGINEMENNGFVLTFSNYFTEDASFREMINSYLVNPDFEKNLKQILIVGDAYLKSLIDEKAYTEFEFSFSEEVQSALDITGSVRPQLCILDILNPQLNTLELLYELQQKKYMQVFVVFKHRPNEFESNKLNEDLRILFEQHKMHPMDILKMIRDSLHLKTQKLEAEYFITSETTGLVTDEKVSAQSGEKVKSILVVDDDEDTLYTIGEIINSLGYKAIYAKNGLECIEILKKTVPDLVLLDIMMPQMDGFETIRKIRKDYKFKDLKVFALTAYAMLSDKDILERNGFDDLITKPVNIVLLKFKLEKLFNQKVSINE